MLRAEFNRAIVEPHGLTVYIRTEFENGFSYGCIPGDLSRIIIRKDYLDRGLGRNDSACKGSDLFRKGRVNNR